MQARVPWTYRMGALADAEDAEEFEEDGAWALYLIFLCCTLALSVVVLNALIAVISETFDRLQEHSEALWVKGQAQLLCRCHNQFVLLNDLIS